MVFKFSNGVFLYLSLQLLEELEVRERGCSSLQEYADLLTLRITEYDPDYLN